MKPYKIDIKNGIIKVEVSPNIILANVYCWVAVFLLLIVILILILLI